MKRCNVITKKSIKKEGKSRLGMVVQASNPSTPEAEAGGPRIQGQPELHSKILSKKKKC
jgi:hypothetical protein